MSISNLNFTGAYTPPASNAVNLKFGALGVVVPDPAQIAVEMFLPAPLLTVDMGYDPNVSRPTFAAPDLHWQTAEPEDLAAASNWVDAQRDKRYLADLWQLAKPQFGQAREAYGELTRNPESLLERWQQAKPNSPESINEAYKDLERTRHALAGLWSQGQALNAQRQGDWVQLKPFNGNKELRWALGNYLSALSKLPFSPGRDMTTRTRVPWERGMAPRAGQEAIAVAPPAPPAYTPAYDLSFVCKFLGIDPRNVRLNFGAHPCPDQYPQLPGQGLIPSRRFYMTTYNVEAQLLPSMADVPIYAGATISQDVGSYGWTLNASGPASLYSQLAAVPGQPKIIQLTINGIVFVFQLDSPKKSTGFGKTQVQITGRSVTALLGTGFAHATTRLSTAPFNAQQLAAQALDGTGITLDWGIDDWLVPAGAWSHYGTPLAAVRAIAEAAGGYVQSHRSLAQLNVRHPYPTLAGGVPGGPWNWNGAFAADVVISPDAIVSRSVEVQPAPAINAVYVSGAEQGILALVKRSGTAGDQLAEMVVDQLITANAAATQRGLAVLGAGRDRLMHQLELPILTGAGLPGILNTDQLIQVNDSVPWRGRIRAVTVTDTRPQLRQSLLVEAA